MRKPTRRCAAAAILLLVASNRTQAQKTEVDPSATPVRSQVWPDRTKIWPKHFYKDRLWWIGEAVIAGLLAADAYSTSVGRSRCPTCVESNILLGPHPTNGQITGATIAFLGVQSGLHAFSWIACPDVNRRSRGWRVACNALVPGIGLAILPRHIIKNFELRSPAGPVPASSSLMIRPEFMSTMPSHSLWRVIPPGSDRILLLPKQFGRCGSSLTLCTSFQTESKVDLRSVHFR
jgi:hypothetical protein